MPVKRPHKKSRFGCDRCRERRVKCDEQLPRCIMCIQRRETCQYSRVTAPRIASVSNSHTDASHSPSPGGSMDTDSSPNVDPEIIKDSNAKAMKRNEVANEPAWESIRFRELELMQHWCITTSNSFSEPLGEVFRGYVVQEALKHGYLMEGLLALTCCHIAYESDDVSRAEEYVNAALRYQSKAALGLRESLANLSPETSSPVFASSLCIMLCSLISPLLPVSRNEPVSSLAEAMLNVADLLKGLATIVVAGRQWIVQGPLVGILDLSRQEFQTAYATFPLEQLQKLNNSRNDSQLHPVFENTIQTLANRSQGRHHLMPWLMRSSPEYMAALRNSDPIARGIFMLWGSMLVLEYDLWWARYSGNVLVKNISAELELLDSDWGPLIRWCREQVGL